MKMIQKRYTLSLVTVVMAFIAQSLLAVDGTWTGLSGGSWTNTANWASGVVADGSAGIADFSTLNITANTYVTLDGPRIIGSLLFKDDVAASHNWTLATGSGGELTLDVGSGSPVINVVNRTAEISAVLTGNDGLTKTGTGALTISGRSNLSGEIFVNQGLLTSTLGGLRDTTGDITVADGATLYLTSGWGDNDGRYDITNSIYISGMGVQTSFGALQGQANLKCQGLVTLLSDAEISQDWNNFYIQGGVNGIDKDLTLRAANAASQPGLQMQSSISLGSGAISVVGSGYVTLYNANNYRGGTIVDVGGSGSLKVEHADALGSGGLTVNNGPVDLRGKSVTLAWLSGSGGEITDTKSGGADILTVTQSIDTVCSTVINNGASDSVALTLDGPGTLTLDAVNLYSGATTVSQGTLIGSTAGSCANSSVTVADGATNGVQVAALGGQWACSNLTYSAGTTTLDINFGSVPPSTTTAPLLVASNLNMGTVGIIVRNGLWPATPGIYPLVSYSGVLSGTVPGTPLMLPSGLTATIVNNIGSKRIDLNVTAVAWSPSSYNTWTNLVSGNASGSWGNSANWSNNIPNAVDAMADFSTLNITADAFVNNDAPRTVGQLRFGDTSPSHNWNLTNAALTLATTLVQPVIDVTNGTATISSPLLGTQGFAKQGSGTLSLSGGNTIAGAIMVSQGVLSAPSVGLRNTSGSVIVSAGAALYVNTGWGQGMANSIFLSGTGRDASRGAFHGENNFVCSGPITLLTDSKITHDWNILYLNGGISGTDKNLELGVTVGGQYPIYINNSVNLGTGTLTVNSVQNGGSGDGCAVALNAANTYSGGTVLTNYATLRLGNAGALGSGGVTLYPNSKLNLNAYNAKVGALSGPGGIITDNGSSAGTTLLTVAPASTTTYSGVITNGATRAIALTVDGTGLLELAGYNTYSGVTTVSNGILGVSGSLVNSDVTVCSGAAFSVGSTGVVAQAELGGTLVFEESSELLVDAFAPDVDVVTVDGNVTIGNNATLQVNYSGSGSGSWKILESAGTVSGTFELVGGPGGTRLTYTASEVWLTIPAAGTVILVK